MVRHVLRVIAKRRPPHATTPTPPDPLVHLAALTLVAHTRFFRFFRSFRSFRSSLFYGYMVALSLSFAVLPFVVLPLGTQPGLAASSIAEREESGRGGAVVGIIGRRIVHLAAVGGFSAFVSSYFILPFLLHRKVVSDVEHR